ncbi:hypothetical protein [Desulfocurvus sp. DL9XJH121]
MPLMNTTQLHSLSLGGPSPRAGRCPRLDDCPSYLALCRTRSPTALARAYCLDGEGCGRCLLHARGARREAAGAFAADHPGLDPVPA